MKKVLTVAVVVLIGISVILFFAFFPKSTYWAERPSFNINGIEVNDFAYQLQNIEINEIANSEYDLIILDYSADGTEVKEFTATEVQQMRKNPKILLSYVSIGEAENYRFYWNNRWDANNDGIPDPGAPEWLDMENPEWEGNYKVHYWDPNWQKIIFGTNSSYIDRILKAGFDGVYLDIIDAYEYYEERGRTTAKEEMINFVLAISEHVKAIKNDFLVFPQNGEALLENSTYRAAIDGIGREDLFYTDDSKNLADVTEEAISYLKLLRDENKPVLIIDYVTKAELIDEVYSLAIDNDFLVYVSNCELDKLITHASYPPD